MSYTSPDMKDRSPATLTATLPPVPETKRGFSLHIDAVARGDLMCYCNGNTVVLRGIADPTNVRMYGEHKCQVNVAKFSPSGRYVASGDAEGSVKIWEICADKFKLRNTFPINSSVKDIAWSPDNKRIIIGGHSEGNTFAKVILVDSGNSVGTITGHEGTVLSVDYRKTRPFRAITTGEDRVACFHQGPPFKFVSSFKGHTNFVQCGRFSPDGSQYVTTSNDCKMYLFDGKTGEQTGEIKQKKKTGHKGTMYSCSWTSDGKQILTSSADKTCKLWDVETKKLVTTFRFGEDVKRPAITDMQVSCLAFQENLISVGLSGAVSFLDAENPDTPKRVLNGCMSNIKSLVVDRENSLVYTGELNGMITTWDLKTNLGKWFSGKSPASAIAGITLNGDKLDTFSYDNKLRQHDVATGAFVKSATAIGGHVVAVAQSNSDPDTTAIITSNQKIQLIKSGAVAGELEIKFDPLSIAFSTDDAKLYVGGKNKMATVFDVSGSSISASSDEPFETQGKTILVAPSPDGQILLCIDDLRSLYFYSTADGTLKNPIDNLRFHNGAVRDVAWSPDGSKLATVGADKRVIVWYDGGVEGHRLSWEAHHLAVAKCQWIDNTTLITAGDERAMKIWDVPAAFV